MFSLRDLRHAYDGRVVLSVERWEVGQGEHWLLHGPSGCGKSTLLHVLAGLLTPLQGHVVLSGQEIFALGAAERDRFRGRTLGLVFQRLHLVEALNVAQNLALARFCAGLPPERNWIEQVLDRLGIAGRSRARPSELSLGEAQRVALARALVNRPSVILADEPTSSLDDDNCARVLDLLVEQATQSGATLLIASHDRRIHARIERRFALGPAT